MACGDPVIDILRYRSPKHKRTVGVLPEFLTPRKRHSLCVISLALYLHFLLSWDLRRVHGTLLEPSYSAMREWLRHWRLNTANLVQMGLPATGVAVDLSSPHCVSGDFGREAFRACVRHARDSEGGAIGRRGDDDIDMDLVTRLGRSVLPRVQSSLQRAFPQLWPFREREA